jgi:broad specificity phosphatase PhoE
MAALTILIIRHAEKPGEAWPGPGLKIDGTPDKEALVIRGWQRAGSWAALFGAGLGGADYPQPQVIFAANPDTPPGGKEPSQRPFETAEPLAARLGLTPVKDFAKGQEEKLAQKLVSLDGIVALVSWGARGNRRNAVTGDRGRTAPAGDATHLGRKPL